MTIPRESPYITWAKTVPHVRFSLAGSGVRPCPPALLGGIPTTLELSGSNDLGWRPLVESVAARYGVAQECVVLAAGTTMANYLAMAALLEPGDHVVLEHPIYDPLYVVPRYLRADTSFFERKADDGYRVSEDAVRQAVTARTRLIVVTDLHNPTGVRLSTDDLDTLVGIAEEADCHLLVDEVYLEWLRTPPKRVAPAPSAVHRSSRVIATSSLTKAYGLGGLRIGWAVTAPPVADRMRRMTSLFDNILAFPSEQLGLRALERAAAIVDDVRPLVDRNRARLRDFVQTYHGQPHGLSWVEPPAGTVAFVHFGGRDVDALVERLMRDYETAIVPGRFFGAPEFARIGCGVSTEVFDEALERIAAALDQS